MRLIYSRFTVCLVLHLWHHHHNRYHHHHHHCFRSFLYCQSVTIETYDLKDDYFLPLQQAQAEIEEHLKTAEMLSLKGDTRGQKEQIMNELIKVHQRFQARIHEYQILLKMTIQFFKNLDQVGPVIKNLCHHVFESLYNQVFKNISSVFMYSIFCITKCSILFHEGNTISTKLISLAALINRHCIVIPQTGFQLC